MKKLMLMDAEKSFELLDEYAGLYADNGGEPDGNCWLPSNQDDIPAEVAKKVVDAGYGRMVNVLMSKDEGMINYFGLAIPEEINDEVAELLKDEANDRLAWAHYGAYGASDSHWVFIKEDEE